MANLQAVFKPLNSFLGECSQRARRECAKIARGAPKNMKQGLGQLDLTEKSLCDVEHRFHRSLSGLS